MPDFKPRTNAGISFLTDFWQKQYLREYIRDGGSKIKFVTGRPGSGKTHFLRLMTGLAQEENYKTVWFSAKDIWMHDFRDIYFFLMAASITLLEYIAGVIFIRGMKIKLWDYSKRWGNIHGIICPLFSFFWMVLSALYYFLIHPHILSALAWLSENLAFSFVIGFFYGVFVLDVIYSTKLMVKIRAFAAESGIIVLVEELREDIRSAFHRHRKRQFFFPMHVGVPIRELLERYQAMHYENKKHLQQRLRNRKQ